MGTGTGTGIAAVIFDFNGVLIEHWDGASWNAMSVPALDGSFALLQAVAARTDDDVWTTGRFFSSQYQHNHTLTLHWDGTTWTALTPSTSPHDAVT